MKSLRKWQLKKCEPSARGYSKTGNKVFKAYLKPRDIPSRKAAKILNSLNSFDSAEQLKSIVQTHTKQMILSTGDAQRILYSKAELGGFYDLQQVATVRGIGAKKFDFIARALMD